MESPTPKFSSTLLTRHGRRKHSEETDGQTFERKGKQTNRQKFEPKCKQANRQTFEPKGKQTNI